MIRRTRREIALESALRHLLDAMDKQFGQPLFSQRVDEARRAARDLVPAKRDEKDRSRE